MVLISNNGVISTSVAKVYENCIKDIDTKDIIVYENKIDMVRAWLPNISSIDVSTDEMVVRLKDEKEEINLGFTGYEWRFNEYINTIMKREETK